MRKIHNLFRKDKYSLSIVLVTYIIISLFIPFVIWELYHKMSWETWNSMLLSYLGGAIGGIATLIALYITTNETRRIQKNVSEDESKREERLREREYISIGTTIMPILEIRPMNFLLGNNQRIDITNIGLNIGQLELIKINDDIHVCRVLIHKGETKVLDIKIENELINEIKHRNKCEVTLEFYDLVNNRYQQVFEIQVNPNKINARLPVFISPTKIDKILDITSNQI